MGLVSTLRAAFSGNQHAGVAPAQPLASGRGLPVTGVTPAGEPIKVEVDDHDVDLVFLTSDCRECRGIWREPGEGTVLVTPDPSTDSRRVVTRLAPPGTTVVMSSLAWHTYGVTKAPWRIRIRGGAVTSSGPA